MHRAATILRLHLLDDRSADLDRACLIVDRLAANRAVEGSLPEWRIPYGTDDVSEAMRMCAADLDLLDPTWHHLLDFGVLSRTAF